MRKVFTLCQILLWALMPAGMQCVLDPPAFGKENAAERDAQRWRNERVLVSQASGSQELKALTPIVDTRRPGKRLLIGRIREVAATDPVSPLSSKVSSERSAAKVPHEVVSPRRSYPADFQGIWSGPFVVVPIAGATTHAQDILYPGRLGNGTVGFIKSKDQGTEVNPLPIVFFDLTDEEKRRLHVPDSQQHAQCHVGFGEARNVVLGSGEIKNSLKVTHVIKLLSDRKTLEEQVVEQSQIYSAQTHKTFAAARESILQFSHLKPDVLDVCLAAVEYRADGTVMGRMILQGRLTRQK